MAGRLYLLLSLFSLRILEENPNTNLQSSLSHQQTKKRGEKPTEPTDIRKNLFLTLCHWGGAHFLLSHWLISSSVTNLESEAESSGFFLLPSSKGKEAASPKMPWPEGELVAQTRGNRILRSCVYPRSWLQQPGCAVHMENMQAGKCLLALAPFMFWTIIFCISTSWKYHKGYGPANEDLLVCSEELWCECSVNQRTRLGEAGAVQSYFDLIYVLGAFSAFTWPPLGVDHESLVLLLAKMCSPWVHFRRIKLSDWN